MNTLQYFQENDSLTEAGYLFGEQMSDFVDEATMADYTCDDGDNMQEAVDAFWAHANTIPEKMRDRLGERNCWTVREIILTLFNPKAYIDRYDRERDRVGIYLSAHPLDEFAIVMECMCNTSCEEISREYKDNHMDVLSNREQITVAGIVTNVVDRLTKAGKPMGIVTLEDFKGAGEIFMVDKQWAQYKGMFTEGVAVFVKMKCEERYRGTGNYSLNVYGVDFLRDVADKEMTDLTIHIDLDTMSKDYASPADEELEEEVNNTGGSLLADLASIIKDSPGTTKLSFSIRDARLSTQPVRMRSGIRGVKVNRQLLDFIHAHECLRISM